MKKINYVNVPVANVQKVKKHVFSLPKNLQWRYYSLINKLSNNFYGSCKSLNDNELAQYRSIVGDEGVFKFKKKG